MHSIPEKALKVLNFLADCEIQGKHVSRHEIAEYMGYVFPSASTKQMEALNRYGYIEIHRLLKRSWQLTLKGWITVQRTPPSFGVPIYGSFHKSDEIKNSVITWNSPKNIIGFIGELRSHPDLFSLKSIDCYPEQVLEGSIFIVHKKTRSNIGVFIENNAFVVEMLEPDDLNNLDNNPQFIGCVIGLYSPIKDIQSQLNNIHEKANTLKNIQEERKAYFSLLQKSEEDYKKILENTSN